MASLSEIEIEVELIDAATGSPFDGTRPVFGRSNHDGGPHIEKKRTTRTVPEYLPQGNNAVRLRTVDNVIIVNRASLKIHLWGAHQPTQLDWRLRQKL